MTRAEIAAKQAYPSFTAENFDEVIKIRHFYAEGYEQAEKDTIKRAHKWIKLHACMFNNMEEVDLFVDLFRKAMEGE